MSVIGAHRDKGKVLTPATVSDGPNPVPTSYTAGSEIRCRARQMPTKDVAQNGVVRVADWEIRIPAGTTVDNEYGFRVTKHRGATVAIDLKVVGRPRVTQGQIVFNARTSPPLTVN